MKVCLVGRNRGDSGFGCLWDEGIERDIWFYGGAREREGRENIWGCDRGMFRDVNDQLYSVMIYMCTGTTYFYLAPPI